MVTETELMTDASNTLSPLHWTRIAADAGRPLMRSVVFVSPHLPV